ncbi:MAG: SBBP repeat-containing protein [Bacteroidetes bacterium]|nr:SBBP repeat-containing protein [Bacteroidota bacterium]
MQKQKLIKHLKKNCLVFILLISVCHIFAARSTDSGLLKEAKQRIKNNGIRFRENKGQLSDMNGKPVPFVLFSAKTPGVNVYVTESGLTYQTIKKTTEENSPKENSSDRINPSREQTNSKTEWERFDVELKGAKIRSENMIREGQSEADLNFFYPNCPHGVYGVKEYDKITIKDIYPGIDWVLYNSTETGFKYDFVVHPGADCDQIALVYITKHLLQINSNGQIEVQTAYGEIIENAPVSYQRNRNIGSAFKITGRSEIRKKGDNGYATQISIGLNKNQIDPKEELIIDPQLAWSTLYGGDDTDFGMSIDTDQNGNVFIAGMIESNLPGTFPLYNSGSSFFQGSHSGGVHDLFILKFTNTGALAWATYYGGSEQDETAFITTDNFNNIFITGYTYSPDFPVQSSAGAYNQPVNSNSPASADGFILKFNNSGTRLWATFYGGSGFDWTSGIAVNNSGDIYITGYTTSNNFPTFNPLNGSYFQGAPVNTGYLFILKFTSSGVRSWATCYGGTSYNTGASITCDNSGNIYVTGRSPGFPVINNTSNPSIYSQAPGGGMDAFILKFNSGGNLMWATNYGGSDDEWGLTIKADNSGNVFVCGETKSADFPVKNAGTFYQGNNAGGYDAFILKFDNNGNLVWASYFGGNADESWSLFGIYDNLEIDNCGNVYMSMISGSSNLVLQNNISGSYFDKSFNGNFDVVLLMFSNTGNLLWSTFWGGANHDLWRGVALDNNDNLYITGSFNPFNVSSASYPLLNPGGTYYFDGNFGSTIFNSEDIYLAKFSKCAPQYQQSQTDPISCQVCNGTASVTVNCGIPDFTYKWSDGTIQNNVTTNVSSINNLCPGNYWVEIKSNCLIQDTVFFSMSGFTPGFTTTAIVNNAPKCNGQTGSVTASITGNSGPYTYSWSTGSTGSTSSTTIILNNVPANNYAITVTDANGCNLTATAAITEPTMVTATITSTNNLCAASANASVNVSAGGGTPGYTYAWSNGANTPTSGNLFAGNYIVTITDNNGCFTTSGTILSDPAPITSPLLTTMNTTCELNNGSITANASGGTGLLTYSWNTGAAGQTILNLSAAIYTVTIVDANSCTRTTTVGLTNSGSAPLITMTSSDILCNGSNTGSISVTLVNGNIPYTYSWSNGSSAITGSTSQQLSNLIAGSYSTTITDANGCSSISSVALTQPAPLALNPVSQNITCANSNGNVTLSIAGGIPPYAFNWSTGQTGITGGTSMVLPNLQVGNYSVTITDGNGCVKTTSAAINTTSPGTIDLVPVQQTISEGGRVTFKVNGGIAYSWAPAAGLSCTDCNNPEAAPNITTTYTVTAVDVNGCTITAMITINVKPPCIDDDASVFIANIFSPNNDGKNDILYIEGNGLTNIYWGIYDRWGNLLFETIDQSHGWDGTKNGHPMENGTYVYYLKGICARTNSKVDLKGNITIVK